MRLFLPQAVLESWMIEEKVALHNGVMSFPGQAAGYPLSPAMHFARLLSGEDVKGLVSKVKTEAQVAGMGGEQLDDAVVFGSTAYQIEPGFVALTELPVLAEATPSTAAAALSEADLLAAFLLNKL